MRTTVLGILLSFFAVIVYSQENSTKIEFQRYEELGDVIDLKGNGLVIRGGFNINLKNESIVEFYDGKGKVIWKKRIKNKVGAGRELKYFISDEKGTIVYYIEREPNMLGESGTFFITQIFKDGKSKSSEVELLKGAGRSTVAIFMDNNYLYVVTTQKGLQQHEDKADEKIILNRISHADFSVTQVIPSLPVIVDGKNSSFWRYEGVIDNVMFFSSNHIDIEKGVNDIRIISMDSDGKILSTVSYRVDLNGKYFQPSEKISESNGSFTLPMNSAYVIEKSVVKSSTTIPEPSTYTYIYLDRVAKEFYLYGQYGAKPFLRGLVRDDGFYVFKFDLSGNLLWKFLHDNSKREQKALLLEETFPGEIYATVLGNDANDDFTLSKSNGQLMVGTENTKLSKYLANLKTREEFRWRRFDHNDGSLLLLIPEKQNSATLLYFSK